MTDIQMYAGSLNTASGPVSGGQARFKVLIQSISCSVLLKSGSGDDFFPLLVPAEAAVFTSPVELRHVFVLQLSQSHPSCEDETMVPVLTSRKASELPVNEVACVLQVSISCRS